MKQIQKKDGQQVGIARVAGMRCGWHILDGVMAVDHLGFQVVSSMLGKESET